jgi:hypothetical protein
VVTSRGASTTFSRLTAHAAAEHSVDHDRPGGQRRQRRRPGQRLPRHPRGRRQRVRQRQDHLDRLQARCARRPLSLPAGTYRVEVTSYTADKTAGKKTADLIGPADVAVVAGHSYTIAAYLTTAGKPTAAVFDNNVSPIPAGKGRVTVAHIADAPTVAITTDGATLIASLSNPNQASAVVPAST